MGMPTRGRVIGCLLLALLLAVRVPAGETEKQEEKEKKEQVRVERIADLPEGQRPAKTYPLHASLPMEALMQNPELPTGCESVALTIALKSLGFPLEKTDIAEEYLVYSQEGNFATGFVGNPFSYDGAGVFPPGIVLTANSFFEEQSSSYRAYDATGLGIYGLLPYVAQGSPVLLWVTIGYGEPSWGGYSSTFNGREYPWYFSEHCVALKGYNLRHGTLTIVDPLEGEVKRSLSAIRDIMEKTGNYAVVLKK